MDIGSDGFFGVESNSIPDPYNLNSDKSVAGFDLTHMVSAGWAYKFPQVHTGSSALSGLANHWQFNGMFMATSGQPYMLTASGDIANTGNTDQNVRLNLVGNPKLPHPTPAQWFDKAAFAVPAQYTFGNLGRNALRADGYINFDLSLFKGFQIGEGKRVEFRAEAFNFTNTPTWAVPGNTTPSPNFDKITSTLSTERQIQLSLKFYF